MANTSVVLGGESIYLPSDTTGNRPGSPSVGMLRFNTTIGLPEIYTATGWVSIGQQPIISNISGAIMWDQNTTITISGYNFTPNCSVYVTGNGVSNSNRLLTATYVNPNIITFSTNAASVNFVSNATFGLLITDTITGLFASEPSMGTINVEPIWSTSSGSLGTFNGASSVSITLSATDAYQSVSYAVTSGSLPSGLSLSSSGVISGTAADVNATSTFSVTPTDGNGFAGTARSFSITTIKRLLTVNGTTYYSNGSASTQTVTLSTAGTVFPITVYNNHSLTITCVGAQGAIGSQGGYGASMTGTISSIGPGTYYAVVGAQGTLSTSTSLGSPNGGGYPGGGNGYSGNSGGGGFSGFWTGNNNPLDTNNLINGTYYIIGGGGAGNDNGDGAGGAAAGYPTGQIGSTAWNCSSPAVAAGGGSQSSGGAAGVDNSGTTGHDGATAGTQFYGGLGGNCSWNGSIACSGGAGGGGWFGGGGGTGHCGDCGSTGGGGSSYYNTNFVSNVSYASTGGSTGNGSVTLGILG
jgi:Glycine rich protein